MVRPALILLSLSVAGRATALSQARPCEPYVVRDVCPYECCQLGTWVARGTIRAFRSRGDRAAVAFTLKAGDTVTAKSGDMVTHRLGRVVVRRHVMPSPETRDSTLRPAVGDTLYLASYGGEGSWMVWYGGRLHWTREFWPSRVGQKGAEADLVAAPRGTWWVRLETRRGLTGWVRAGMMVLDGVENVGPGFSGADACGGNPPAD